MPKFKVRLTRDAIEIQECWAEIEAHNRLGAIEGALALAHSGKVHWMLVGRNDGNVEIASVLDEATGVDR